MSVFVDRVLQVHDTPHRIGLGVATGIFVAWTPTVGFQMALTVALAWLVGANKVVGVPFVWISCPPTYFATYYAVVINRRKMPLFHLAAPQEARDAGPDGAQAEPILPAMGRNNRPHPMGVVDYYA